jgi:hypothetical protein
MNGVSQTPLAALPGKSGGGPPQSKTLARFLLLSCARSVLECASPLALWPLMPEEPPPALPFDPPPLPPWKKSA